MNESQPIPTSTNIPAANDYVETLFLSADTQPKADPVVAKKVLAAIDHEMNVMRVEQVWVCGGFLFLWSRLGTSIPYPWSLVALPALSLVTLFCAVRVFRRWKDTGYTMARAAHRLSAARVIDLATLMNRPGLEWLRRYTPACRFLPLPWVARPYFHPPGVAHHALES